MHVLSRILLKLRLKPRGSCLEICFCCIIIIESIFDKDLRKTVRKKVMPYKISTFWNRNPTGYSAQGSALGSEFKIWDSDTFTTLFCLDLADKTLLNLIFNSTGLVWYLCYRFLEIKFKLLKSMFSCERSYL